MYIKTLTMGFKDPAAKKANNKEYYQENKVKNKR
jgi:hypothetical protein